MAIAGASSVSICVVVLLTQSWHARFSMDSDLTGIQKFHKRPVPRIGGVALIAGLLAVPVSIYVFGKNLELQQYAKPMLFAVLAASPAFLAGLAEDLTKSVSVRARLIATFFSALLGAWLLGAALNRMDVVGLDLLLGFAPVSLVVTAVAVGGLANSINIIDGFNGIASGVAIVILGGIAMLAHGVGDQVVMHLCLLGAGAAIGLALLNFPTGRLFMGDGGAYLLGFWIGEMAVLLVARNAQITAWQLLVGDESALPAILGILDSAPTDLRAEVFIEIPHVDGRRSARRRRPVPCESTRGRTRTAVRNSRTRRTSHPT